MTNKAPASANPSQRSGKLTDAKRERLIEIQKREQLKGMLVNKFKLKYGNNANISPNMRLFYLETIMPIIRKYTSAMERYFGYDIDAITSNVSALQPELKDIAAYNVSLVNGGISTPNEARIELRYDTKPGNDDLRIPANIAGSAGNPALGGAPKKPEVPKP